MWVNFESAAICLKVIGFRARVSVVGVLRTMINKYLILELRQSLCSLGSSLSSFHSISIAFSISIASHCAGKLHSNNSQLPNCLSNIYAERKELLSNVANNISILSRV